MNIDSVDTKKLVDFIVKEVTKRITEVNTHKFKTEKEKVLCISMMPDDLIDNSEDHLRHIDYLENMGEDLDINSYKHLIVGTITNTQLACIALGIANDRITSTIVDFILHGKKIYIINEEIQYRSYKNSFNIEFYKMLQSYEEKLRLYGVDFINRKDIPEVIGKDREETREVLEKDYYVVKEKIVTERLIKKIYQSGYKKILVNKGVIVTPLAKDFIRDNSINILTT